MPQEPHAPYTSESTSLGPAYGDRPTRMSLFWQRQRRRLRMWGAGFLVLGVVGASGWGTMHFLSDEEKAGLREKLSILDPLPIKHIEIQGRELTDEADVLEMLGTHVGNGLFGFSVEAARKRIDSLPFVDHTTVERRLPGSIVVTLTERIPIAIWQNEGHFQIINTEGKKVSEENISDEDANVFRKLPLVVGRGANTEAADVITTLNRYHEVRARTLALVRVGERRWNVVLGNGMQILLPEGQEDASFHRLTEYQDSLHLLDRPLAAIDMRLPDRMIIKLRPQLSKDVPAPSHPISAAAAEEAHHPSSVTAPPEKPQVPRPPKPVTARPHASPNAPSSENHLSGQAVPHAAHPRAEHADRPSTSSAPDRQTADPGSDKPSPAVQKHLHPAVTHPVPSVSAPVDHPTPTVHKAPPAPIHHIPHAPPKALLDAPLPPPQPY